MLRSLVGSEMCIRDRANALDDFLCPRSAAQRDVSAEMNAAAATVAAEVEAITALQREAEAWSARFEAARHDGTTADAAALDALLREAEALEVRPPKGAGEEASSS